MCYYVKMHLTKTVKMSCIISSLSQKGESGIFRFSPANQLEDQGSSVREAEGEIFPSGGSHCVPCLLLSSPWLCSKVSWGTQVLEAWAHLLSFPLLGKKGHKKRSLNVQCSYSMVSNTTGVLQCYHIQENSGFKIPPTNSCLERTTHSIKAQMCLPNHTLPYHQDTKFIPLNNNPLGNMVTASALAMGLLQRDQEYKKCLFGEKDGGFSIWNKPGIIC